MRLSTSTSLASFVERPGTTEYLSSAQLFEALDQGVRERSIITLAGPSGSGKKTLLDNWARQRSQFAGRENIIVISMSPSPEKSLPAINIALSRLWHELQELSPPAIGHGYHPRERNIRIYNTRQLETLRIEVQKAIEDAGIKAIVVVRSHLFDEDALTWLLDMRSYRDHNRGYRPRFALILACTSKTDESTPNPITQLQKLQEVKAEWKQLRLSYLGKAEFDEVAGLLIRIHLNAIFDPALNATKIGEDWRKLTVGNWWLLRALTKFIDDELGPQKGSAPRLITQAVLDRVNARYNHTGT